MILLSIGVELVTPLNLALPLIAHGLDAILDPVHHRDPDSTASCPTIYW